MNILAISGSLRRVSSNTTLLRAACLLTPAGMNITLYDGLGDLPHFNPGLELEGDAPPSVTDLRDRIRAADGVLICSPEYAHGVPGVLKNALDWLVSSGETVGKPFALLNASPRSTHAQASLAEVLTTMAAVLVQEASVSVPLGGKNLDEAGIVAHPEIGPTVQAALAAFAQSIAADKTA